MDFSSQILLENERALLRPIKKSDAKDLFHIANDPEIWRFTTTSVTNKAEMKRYIEHALAALQNKSRYPFLVVDKLNGNIGIFLSIFSDLINPTKIKCKFSGSWLLLSSLR